MDYSGCIYELGRRYSDDDTKYKTFTIEYRKEKRLCVCLKLANIETSILSMFSPWFNKYTEDDENGKGQGVRAGGSLARAPTRCGAQAKRKNPVRYTEAPARTSAELTIISPLTIRKSPLAGTSECSGEGAAGQLAIASH